MAKNGKSLEALENQRLQHVNKKEKKVAEDRQRKAGKRLIIVEIPTNAGNKKLLKLRSFALFAVVKYKRKGGHNEEKQC